MFPPVLSPIPCILLPFTCLCHVKILLQSGLPDTSREFMIGKTWLTVCYNWIIIFFHGTFPHQGGRIITTITTTTRGTVIKSISYHEKVEKVNRLRTRINTLLIGSAVDFLWDKYSNKQKQTNKISKKMVKRTTGYRHRVWTVWSTGGNNVVQT